MASETTFVFIIFHQIQMDSLSKRESLEYRPVSGVFLSLARFGRHRETTLCMNRVRCLLSTRGMLLVIASNPVLIPVCFISGLGYDHRFINKQDARTGKKKKLRVENKTD